MNSKITTNSQLSTTEHKTQNQKQTKQTTGTGTESQKWFSAGRGRGENEGKVQGIRSIINRYEIYKEKLKIV